MPEELTPLEEDTQKDKYLTFRLADESYGIDISAVIEIIGIQAITVVPEVPAYVKGIINLRGKIIPVVDMRLRFGKEFLPYHDRTCIVVIEVRNQEIGLIVDAVSEVLTIPPEKIVPPPRLKAAQNEYVRAIGKSPAAQDSTGAESVNKEEQVTLLLDWEKLFGEEAQAAMREAAGEAQGNDEGQGPQEA